MKLRWDRFQILALASAVGAFVLMVAGGFVTQTPGAGVGCPDWPLCGGSLFPNWDNRLMVIEWIHRTVAAIVGVLVLLTTFSAWRDRRGEMRILWTATMSLVLVIVQAGLGGATVLSDLNPAVVVLHLSMAAAFFAMAVSTSLLASILPKPGPAPATAPGPTPETTLEGRP